ncbi:ABC transporter substrate-binding protein [Paenibacillus protaetiae]|uniref:Iron-uptake system-binding protein n=1 Tax=Paenibacillus protaetiae TaxID=2509456 RepID=A0A4P6EWT6_9BACL|nr:ABC transporter substrate-binding protein [Paenibacillus protaetiae]QAY66673.1 iron-uptake system-binding protein [Paenibacillus protaetiae]
MKKIALGLGLALLVLVLAACGSNNQNEAPQQTAAAETAAPEATPTASADAAGQTEGETKTIQYLGKSYVVPSQTDRIVITGALEAMEDSILLNVHPVGAISVGGEFPAMFSSIVDKAESVGEKTEPDFEKILQLKPDVILASTKFPAEVLEKLEKIAPTLPYSHVSTDWEANLTLLGELSGKQDEAAKQIADYKTKLDEVKGQLGDMSGKSVLAVRIRQGQVFVYSASTFFNPLLYQDLGLAVPEPVKAAKAQEAISVEKLAELNPDVLIVQFSPDENKDAPNAEKELERNPILKATNAVKNGQMLVNLVDPLAQGGTAYSKVAFLQAFAEHIAK